MFLLESFILVLVFRTYRGCLSAPAQPLSLMGEGVVRTLH